MNSIDEILENLTMNQKREVPELTGFEKQRVVNRTMDKINPEKAAHHSAFRRAALVCAVCLCFVTSVAAAAGFFKLDEIFYKYLCGSNTNAEVSGEDIMASDSSNGITVTAKQVIGDDYGFYVIFDVSKKDNIKIAVNTAEVEIEGAEVYQCSDIILMQDEAPNTFMLHIMSAENLQGRKISVCLNGEINNEDSSNWNLDWKIDYSNSAKSFDVSKQVEIYGGKALWKSASISPVSVSINISDLNGTKIHCKSPNDLIKVTMKDGSIFSSADSEDTDVLQDTDFIVLSFNRIIDIGNVKSISFAGIDYELN